MTSLNETHNPTLKSWVRSAHLSGCDFPIQNLPFAVFRRTGSAEAFRGGVAIGDQILDLAAVAQTGVFKGEAAAAMQAGAIGGKILGAGGGGFMLLFAKPEKQAAIRERLKDLVHVNFNFDDSGSKVVLYQPNGL